MRGLPLERALVLAWGRVPVRKLELVWGRALARVRELGLGWELPLERALVLAWGLVLLPELAQAMELPVLRGLGERRRT